jgi:hypothetical protein
LFIRIETDTDFMFISRSKAREWCSRNSASYTAMRQRLEKLKVLVDPGKRKVLGARTEFAGSQQPCWVLDLKNQHMGKYTSGLADEIKMRETSG